MIETGNLIIRPLQQGDAEYMVKWLSDPEILEWYEGRDQPHGMKRVKEHYYLSEEPRVKRNLILLDGSAIGYVQYYPLSDKEKSLYGYINQENIYGMDQFIGERELQDKGIGPLFINAVVDFLFENLGAELVVMDPQLRNKRALRCYEKCGFTPVKILPHHEKHEGIMEDCLLIEKRKD